MTCTYVCRGTAGSRISFGDIHGGNTAVIRAEDLKLERFLSEEDVQSARSHLSAGAAGRDGGGVADWRQRLPGALPAAGATADRLQAVSGAPPCLGPVDYPRLCIPRSLTCQCSALSLSKVKAEWQVLPQLESWVIHCVSTLCFW